MPQMCSQAGEIHAQSRATIVCWVYALRAKHNSCKSLERISIAAATNLLPPAFPPAPHHFNS